MPAWATRAPKRSPTKQPTKQSEPFHDIPTAPCGKTALFSNTRKIARKICGQNHRFMKNSAKSTQKTGPQIAFEVKIRQKRAQNRHRNEGGVAN
jgi:hypothetical protein